MASFVPMGEYFRNGNKENGCLVKTVCRAYNIDTNEYLICYCIIDDGGFAGEVRCMSEQNFKIMFMGK